LLARGSVSCKVAVPDRRFASVPISPRSVDATPAGRTENYQQQADYFANASYRTAHDPVVAAYAQPKLDFIEQLVPLTETSVLDVGCGNGVFTLYLRDRCRSVTGVDFSARMLSENPCQPLIQADVEHLPIQADSYDVCFEANVLHHVDSPERVVKEMARVSRRWVVLLEPNRNNPVMFAFGLLVKAERASLRSHAGGLRTLAESCGLTVRLSLSTGMISQNNTPEALIPLLRYFDRPFAFGEYLIVVAEKTLPQG
jgi:SAM-dependent methyltransferase